MLVLIGAEVLDALVVSASIARRTFKLDQIHQPHYMYDNPIYSRLTHRLVSLAFIAVFISDRSFNNRGGAEESCKVVEY